MRLEIYNVLSGKKEEFKPIRENQVNMYACGITVSDNAHIGHAFQAVVFDTIRKYLRYKGYNVKYVRNYTDVDDKIIINARKTKENPLDYANRFIDKTNKELDTLDVEVPTIQARATESIEDMIEFVKVLIEKGYAYPTEEGNVYYDVTKFNNYGNFANRNMEENILAVRKDLEPDKKNANDFALWKNAKDDEIFWDSPWGKGRPGWHIECSVMSMKYLGETIDIHGGGRDLKFPHHENEIAQSEAYSGKKFANYWIHNGLIKVDGQKMSKSLGNGILLQDLIEEYDSDVIKFTLLQNNYRSDVNIVGNIFKENEKKIYNAYKTFKKIDELTTLLSIDNEAEIFNEIKTKFETAMDNDFNTALVLSDIMQYVSKLNVLIQSKNYQEALNMKAAILKYMSVINLFQKDPDKVINFVINKYLKIYNVTVIEIDYLLKERKLAKENKDYEKADEIRGKLKNLGIIINDTPLGATWDVEIK